MIKTKTANKILSIIFALTLIFNQGLSTIVLAQMPPPPPPGASSPPPPPPPPSSDPTSTPAPTANPTSAPTLEPTNNPPAPTEAPPNPYETPTPTPIPNVNGNSVLTPTPTLTLSESVGGDTVNDTPKDQSIAQNTSTGANSTNTTDITNNNNTSVANNNDAFVNNNISIDVNTGNNNADFNTGMGNVQTGNAVASVSLTNNLNSNVTGTGGFQTINVGNGQTGDIVFSFADSNLTQSFQNGLSGNSYTQAGLAVAENAISGADSTNNSSIQNTNTESTTNNNNGNLVNNININANTGNNSASYNTYGGTIETGDAVVSANIMNILNSNFNVDKWLFGVVNILGDYIGNIILPQEEGTAIANTTVTYGTGNIQTGANSTNNSSLENNNTYAFNNYNNTQAVNNVETSALTGMNNSSYNTAGGEVASGSSNVNISENTVANTNIQSDGTVWLVFVNKLGQWFGYIIGENTSSLSGVEAGTVNTEAGNVQTGANSENNSTVTNTNSESVTNTNNGNIINNISLGANTGDNKSSYNTLGGDVKTGQSSIGLNLVNFVNTNIVAKKIAVLFVNVFGNWIGNIIPPNQEEGRNPTPTQSNDKNIGDPPPEITPPPQFANNNPSNTNEQINDNQNETFTNNDSQETQVATVIKTVKGTKITYYYAVDEETYMMEYINYVKPTVRTIKRGLFVSPTFAKETEPTIAGALFNGKDVVNLSWLIILIPLMLFLIVARRKFVFLPFKVYFAKIIAFIL